MASTSSSAVSSSEHSMTRLLVAVRRRRGRRGGRRRRGRRRGRRRRCPRAHVQLRWRGRWRGRRRRRLAGGGLDGGGGETLAACAAAACRSGGPRPVASILCEHMRSGRCQYVCMRCDPPISSRCAHLEEEVAVRKQLPAEPPQARGPGRRRECRSWRSTGAAHARPDRPGAGNRGAIAAVRVEGLDAHDDRAVRARARGARRQQTRSTPHAASW